MPLDSERRMLRMLITVIPVMVCLVQTSYSMP